MSMVGVIDRTVLTYVNLTSPAQIHLVSADAFVLI
jgi:hypothetical protein